MSVTCDLQGLQVLLPGRPGGDIFGDHGVTIVTGMYTVTAAGLERLAAQRRQRLRDSMREPNTPVLLVLDSVNIQ